MKGKVSQTIVLVSFSSSDLSISVEKANERHRFKKKTQKTTNPPNHKQNKNREETQVQVKMTIRKNECLCEPVPFFLGRASVFNEGMLRNNSYGFRIFA